MLTEAKYTAGEPGGGPKTEEGKEIARWNAARHGIRSPAPVVPGVEKPEDWEAYRDGMLEDLAPLGKSGASSRGARGYPGLAPSSRDALRDGEHSPLSGEGRGGSRQPSPLRFARSRGHPPGGRARGPEGSPQDRAGLEEVPDYPDEKKLSGPDAAAVLWAVAGRVDEEVDLEELDLAELGVPEWAGIYGDAAEWDGWSVGLVRECLSLIASAAGEALEELMDGAREKARLDVISAKHTAEEVEKQLQNMRRERLLPDVRTLEKVSRYEAHLSRLMFKALHELEALQGPCTNIRLVPLDVVVVKSPASNSRVVEGLFVQSPLQVRRSGGAAPLARLDVD